MPPFIDTLDHNEQSSGAERNRLVRLCVRLTGNRDVAEDLAQETLIVAWQQKHCLRDPTRYTQWVNGIARHLCLHWLRDHRRERAYRIEAAPDSQVGVNEDSQAPIETFDLELELERHELAHLLDQALALLPPLTRAVLIERFIHESPQIEVAQQLGLTEGAVEARVQRGKLTMRRVLTTVLQDHAVAYGLIKPNDGWQETRIWCPGCGQHRLRGYVTTKDNGSLLLQCVCGANFGTTDVPNLFDNIQGFRAALTRASKWHHTFFQHSLQHGQVGCLRCGQPVYVQREPNPDLAVPFTHSSLASPETDGIWLRCTACKNWERQTDIMALAQQFPEVQQFWREHPRMFALPLRTIEAAGAPAFLVSVRDVTSHAQIDLVLAQATLMRLHL